MSKPKTIGEMYEKMPRGLLDCVVTTDLTPRWPTTLRGWLSLAVGTLICDVLRRCVYSGCWRRAKYTTLLSGRMCSECYADYYGMNEDAP